MDWNHSGLGFPSVTDPEWTAGTQSSNSGRLGRRKRGRLLDVPRLRLKHRQALQSMPQTGYGDNVPGRRLGVLHGETWHGHTHRRHDIKTCRACKSAQDASQPETLPETGDSLTYSRSDYAADDITTQTAPSSEAFPQAYCKISRTHTCRLSPSVPSRRAPHHQRRQTRGKWRHYCMPASKYRAQARKSSHESRARSAIRQPPHHERRKTPPIRP